MQTEKRLYLIPSTLGDSALNRVIPDYNLEIIQSLDHFVVEEERSARRFLIRCGYKKEISGIRFFILNEHTDERDIPSILKESGDNNVGLLSEAGLPAVADPGSLLVREAHRLNITVIPLTGPSSLMLALMASGLNGQLFSFNGYLPVKPEDRTAKIRFYEKRSEIDNQSQIFIEAPYRNNQLMGAFLSVLKSSTLLCVAMNLSLPDEWIRTRNVGEWTKKTPPDLHKKPAVFIIQAG
jgi:16S rRNA (cytidine1402-2'-O)-methyltransferase